MTLKSLRIIGLDYAIEVDPAGPSNRELDSRNYAGWADHNRRKITIDGTVDPNSRLETLLHEVVHCVDCATSPTGKRLREDQIYRLSRGLYAVLRDNPKLVRLFLE